MIGKVAGLARALAILLAVVAAFVAIPNVNVALVIVLLSLVAGLANHEGGLTNLLILVIGLPLIGVAVGHIPAVGAQLTAVAGNLGLGAASAAATMVVMNLYNIVKGDLTGLAK